MAVERVAVLLQELWAAHAVLLSARPAQLAAEAAARMAVRQCGTDLVCAGTVQFQWAAAAREYEVEACGE